MEWQKIFAYAFILFCIVVSIVCYRIEKREELRAKHIKRKAVVMYETEIIWAKERSINGRTKRHGRCERIYLSPIPSKDSDYKLMCRETIWVNGGGFLQYDSYKIQNDTLVLLYEHFNTASATAYQILKGKIKRLGDLYVGKRKAKPGTFLNPTQPGKKGGEYFFKKRDRTRSAESICIREIEQRTTETHTIIGEGELNWSIIDWRANINKNFTIEPHGSIEDDEISGNYKLKEVLEYKDTIIVVMKNSSMRVFEYKHDSIERYYEVTAIDNTELNGYLLLSDDLGEHFLNEIKRIRFLPTIENHY